MKNTFDLFVRSEIKTRVILVLGDSHRYIVRLSG